MSVNHHHFLHWRLWQCVSTAARDCLMWADFVCSSSRASCARRRQCLWSCRRRRRTGRRRTCRPCFASVQVSVTRKRAHTAHLIVERGDGILSIGVLVDILHAHHASLRVRTDIRRVLVQHIAAERRFEYFDRLEHTSGTCKLGLHYNARAACVCAFSARCVYVKKLVCFTDKPTFRAISDTAQ